MRREKSQRYIGAHINLDLYEHLKAEARRQDRSLRYVLEQIITRDIESER